MKKNLTVFMDVIVGGDIINNEDSAVRNQTVIVLHTVWILIDLCAGWHPVILVTIISLKLQHWTQDFYNLTSDLD